MHVPGTNSGVDGDARERATRKAFPRGSGSTCTCLLLVPTCSGVFSSYRTKLQALIASPPPGRRKLESHIHINTTSDITDESRRNHDLKKTVKPGARLRTVSREYLVYVTRVGCEGISEAGRAAERAQTSAAGSPFLPPYRGAARACACLGSTGGGGGGALRGHHHHGAAAWRSGSGAREGRRRQEALDAPFEECL